MMDVYEVCEAGNPHGSQLSKQELIPMPSLKFSVFDAFDDVSASGLDEARTVMPAPSRKSGRDGIIAPFQSEGFAMPLQRGEILGYDFNRMVVEFTMLNQDKTVRCAISTAAMDDLEGKRDVKEEQRVDQFTRLRDAIEERASRKFFEGPVETKGPVVLRSNDFFK
jgi:hypothetical protein